jgi:hypothetical protein
MGTPETWKTCVVLLITQRSQVQILPPLPSSRSEASSDHGGGLLLVVCTRICAAASRATGVLLALLYLHPDQGYTLTEAGRLISASPEVMQIEAAAWSGWAHPRGQAGPSATAPDRDTGPVSRPLTDLLAVTYGPLLILTDLVSAVEGVQGGIAPRARSEHQRS